MMQEVLPSGKSQEILPTGTALQKAHELYEGLNNIEALPSDDRKEKTVQLDNGWIKIGTGTDYDLNPIATITVVDNKRGRNVICTISSDGKSSFQLSLPRTRISVGDSTFISDTHSIYIRPEVKDEKRVMLAFVNWAKESIAEGTVTEHPYELEDLPVQIGSPRASTPQLT